MSHEDLTQIIAKNITSLRHSCGMTQAELAEKLGYSDKSVSKWERAEGLPDIVCLKKISDLFGVTVDYLLRSDHDYSTSSVKNSDSLSDKKNKYIIDRRAIVLLSIASVWLLAAIVYVIIYLAHGPFILSFVVAAVISALLLVIFNSLWGRRKWSFWAVDFLVWSILFMICYICREHNLWILMVLGIPAALVVWLACTVKKEPKNEE